MFRLIGTRILQAGANPPSSPQNYAQNEGAKQALILFCRSHQHTCLLMNHSCWFALFYIAHMEARLYIYYFHPVKSHKTYTVFQYLICIFLILSFLLEKTLKVSITKGYFFTLTALADDSVIVTNAISHVLLSSVCLYVLKVKPRHVHAYTTCVECGLMYRQGHKMDSLLFSPQLNF